MSNRKKVQNVNDLRQHLIDMWAEVEQSVISDGIDQWRRCFYACIRATEGHFDYSLWHILVKTLRTVINRVKIIVKQGICFRLSLVPDIYFHNSVATRLRYSGIFNDYFITHCLLNQTVKIKLQIGLHLARLSARVYIGCPVFLLTGYISTTVLATEAAGRAAGPCVWNNLQPGLRRLDKLSTSL